ncbi:glycosyltransferase family 1 protein [Marinomonas algicola]|uniref:glycosyltransferase family 1 protein n=1 Tax=Marinomonas algicola TaxID=2773454 RepID=UPI00174B9D4D|nr:glycosyltransferase family 1 protein [Marinomonas algicola]
MKWIVFAEDWNSHPSSTQHFFKRIVQNEPVIWMNSIGLRSPTWNHRDLSRLVQKAKSVVFKPQQFIKESHTAQSCYSINSKQIPWQEIQWRKTQDPIVIAPKALPFHQSALARRVNAYSLSKQINHQVSTQWAKSLPCGEGEKEEDTTILWLSLPSAVDMIGRCNEDLSIYYCGDDFSSLAGVDHSVIGKMEIELAEKCDLIFTASETLRHKFPAHKTHLLEHGVDYRLFQTPKPKPDNFPTGKVMGFYGQLADWVDIDLLIKLSETYPDWTIMLIGQIDTDTKSLLSRHNVKQLPPMSHPQLAAFAQHWDIALLPFKHCQQIHHCNPLKLREYLATGTPIVCTDFPAARPYQPHLTLVKQEDCFINKVNQTILSILLLDEAQQVKRKTAQQLSVYKSSWEQKVRTICHTINQHRRTPQPSNGPL